MRQKTMSTRPPAEKAVRDIRRKTREQYSTSSRLPISSSAAASPCASPLRNAIRHLAGRGDDTLSTAASSCRSLQAYSGGSGRRSA